jgi:FHA domain
MPRCPKGHESVATDYCDECGTPIGGQQAIPVSAPPASAAPPAQGAAGASVAGGGEVCPNCGTPRAGRFCEVCGHDFVLGGGEEPTSVPVPTSPPEPPVESGNGSGLPHRSAAGPGWRVVAAADPGYHARMQAAAVPEAPAIPFPSFCPERRFPLRTAQQLVGRRRPSRGIEPDIDLTGPPEDPAVSHAHALLVAGPDGGWSVVDLESANGTYLNDSAEPIEPHVPVPLKEGDRIHVGAWTTLTVQREEASR